MCRAVCQQHAPAAGAQAERVSAALRWPHCAYCSPTGHAQPGELPSLSSTPASCPQSPCLTRICASLRACPLMSLNAQRSLRLGQKLLMLVPSKMSHTCSLPRPLLTPPRFLLITFSSQVNHGIPVHQCPVFTVDESGSAWYGQQHVHDQRGSLMKITSLCWVVP